MINIMILDNIKKWFNKEEAEEIIEEITEPEPEDQKTYSFM